MTYENFKTTDIYRNADVLEVFSNKTGLEFEDDFPEAHLDAMEVMGFSIRGGWVSVTLQ